MYLDIEVKVDTKVDVGIHIADVIGGINDVPMKNRWNFIAQIINGVHLNLTDTTDEQKEVIKKYLTDKLKLF